MEINWNQLRADSVSMQFYTCNGILNLNWINLFLYEADFQI